MLCKSIAMLGLMIQAALVFFMTPATVLASIVNLQRRDPPNRELPYRCRGPCQYPEKCQDLDYCQKRGCCY
ncbi:hypothetical protein BCR37DRAFT_384495 [Protomyces lactucae-debilis]|uniref:Uncharacterized protein n=1 Tax=Protomyces lactucae-debilis TaxID=2754530 RepID=A0A1Y2ERZ7_PROLT|nr:uncharacterized protein BCR37DRAFT_384495 [Protomyces lactucae-debilis]ORY74371.1 hypothetical protein BCR37DRAFT_384495 [Protomyces lactucae-debilis]